MYIGPKHTTRTGLHRLGGGYRLKGHDQFFTFTEADQVAAQHIRQTSGQLVISGAHLHNEGALGFAQVAVAAENAVAVEGETQPVRQFCSAELAAHVRAELLDVSGGAVGCYDGALAYRQGFRGGVILSGVFLGSFSHGGLLLIYAEFSSMPKKAHHTEPGIRRRMFHLEYSRNLGSTNLTNYHCSRRGER